MLFRSKEGRTGPFEVAEKSTEAWEAEAAELGAVGDDNTAAADVACPFCSVASASAFARMWPEGGDETVWAVAVVTTIAEGLPWVGSTCGTRETTEGFPDEEGTTTATLETAVEGPLERNDPNS